MKKCVSYAFLLCTMILLHSISLSTFAQCPLGSTQVEANNVLGYSSTINDAPTGSGVWSNTYTLTTIPDYIDPLCSASIPAGRITVSLVKVNYGFNIPCNATINQVDMIFYRRNNATVGDVRDIEVFLRLPDHRPSTYNAATATPWLNSTSSFETRTYSHANWGEVLTPDIINDPRFGIQLRSQNNDPSNAALAEIDAIQMRICYTVSGTPYTAINYSVAVSGDELCTPIQEGDITISAVNGSGTYQYSIDGGTNWQSSNVFSNITQGNYEVSVKNSDNTCETKDDIVYVGCNTGNLLQYGDAVLACKSNGGNTPTLGIKPIQAFPQLYGDGNVGYDISDSIPNSPYMWSYNQLGGDVFATTIDQNYNIYTGVTGLYDLSPSPVPVTANLIKIDGVTGAVNILATLPGTAGIGYLEWDTLCNQLYVVNMDDGKIYRYTNTGTLLSTYDPITPDVTADGIAPLGERVLGIAYNYAQGRLYYSLWKNDGINNGLRNEIRSVAISGCDFDASSDRLEISLPFLSEYGSGGAYSMPVGDVEISADGQTILLSEIGFNSLIPVGQPHESRILEYRYNGTSWALDTSRPIDNSNIKHEIGQLSAGKNSRGGIDFAYQTMNGGCTSNANAFIVATGDAFTGVTCEVTGCYYGLQYWPITGGNYTNAILMDIARSPLSQEKSIYGDVDVVSGCCPCAIYCPMITQPSNSPITVCVGETGSNITVQTDQNAANSISFVKFTSDQMSGTTPTASEAAAIYGGSAIATVTPTYDYFPYTATYTFNPADFPNTTDNILTYYVYAVLNPDMGATCRPVQEIEVKILPKNAGMVWIDTNNDGIQDPDETQGVVATVTAYWDDCAGNTGVVTTTTDSEGYYVLLGIPDGAKMRVEFNLPSGTYVQGVSGTDNQTTTQFAVAPDCNIDVAVTQSDVLQIGNYVWQDADADGVQDPCETPLANVEVQLKQGTTVVGKTYTAADGSYYFGGNNNEGFTFESATTSAQTVVTTITNTIDDARQNATGVGNNAAGLLFNDRYLGLRYTNIDIPAGAVITSATIRFTASAAGNIANVSIKGDTNLDESAWVTGASPYISNIYNTSATTGQVTWNNSNTWVIGESGADQTTPDLSAIVSELINSPTWERNKTLAFVINAPANATGATAYDVSGNAGAGAVLTINYIGTSQITGGSLAPNTAYTICIPLNQTPIESANLVPTLANSTLNNGNDQNDSDGLKVGTAVAIDITSPASGANHTYDFGFVTCSLTATANNNQSNVSCNGGSDGATTAVASGNIGAVTYSWSNGATTATISGLTAGDYTVTITETPTCTAVAMVTITQPTALSITCNSTNVTTNGGSNGTASVSASDGTSPYTYAWDSGETTASISGKTAGAYTVTVTDNNGCTAACISTINEPGCNLTATANNNQTNVSCNGGSDGATTAVASGNIGAVTYSWSNGETTATISNLTAGDYTVTITETPTCTAVAMVTITQPTAMSLTCDKTDVTTNGGSDGTASVSAIGGTSPYTYSWGSSETTLSISNKAAGAYTVTVTDNNGCTAACISTINEPGCNLSATANNNQTNVSCNGGSDGATTAVASGNIGAVTYLWGNGATTATISNLTAGDYTVTITETPTCTAVASVTITQPTVLSLTCSKTDVTTNGGSDGTASVSAIGGTSPYTYAWSSGETTASISNKTSGTYTVTVTDNNGCTAACGSTINEPGVSPDLSLTKTANTAISTVGGTVTFTLTLTNDNGVDATGVVVTDYLPAGVTFVSTSDPANASLVGNNVVWNVGTFLGTDAPKTLTITVTANGEGSFVNNAEITATNEGDNDSTPNNDVIGEDDQDQACFSVPISLCSDSPTANIIVTANAATSYQWYISTDNGVTYTALSGETAQTLVINNTLMGGNGVTKYFKAAYNGADINAGCGQTMCCPIIVTTQTCTVCPPPKCLTITVTRQ